MTASNVQKMNREKGRRAEEVGVFYLRLNGFFTIPNFAVHHNSMREFARTEADVVGVRFPLGVEHSGHHRMKDDPLFVKMAGDKTLFVLVEIKAGLCNINGPWSKEGEAEENLIYVIKRLGIVPASKTSAIAGPLFRSFTWEDEKVKVVRLCIGSRHNSEVRTEQILFENVAAFFRRRFSSHPLKLPGDVDSLWLWGDFGYELAQWCKEFVTPTDAENLKEDDNLRSAIVRYIESGSMKLPPYSAGS